MGVTTTLQGPAPSPQSAGVNPTGSTAELVTVTPFLRATTEHVEPLSFDQSSAIGANSVDYGPQPIGAFGYLRSIWLLVEATGGTGTAAVYQEDAPWSVLSEVQVLDVNGGQLFGPVTGYELFLINLLSGYTYDSDPTVMPTYTTPTTAGNFAFALRIPVELSSREGLGALPNGNSSSTFKLRVVRAGTLAVYSTNPTTLPTVRIRAWQEDYTQPKDVDNGVYNEVRPPVDGTTQFWTRQVLNIAAGSAIPMTERKGNLIRNLILIWRNTTPARADSTFPDPIKLKWDSVEMLGEPRLLRKQYMRERTGYAPPTGVFMYDFTHEFDGKTGTELRDLWLPTLTSSRIEWEGTFGVAGTLTILTNDVAVPAGKSVWMS